MGFSVKQMHKRYMQQAGWTEALRAHLFEQVGMERAEHVLEVGCGTGAALKRWAQGLDIHLPTLRWARAQGAEQPLVAGDGHRLPYPADHFNIVYCHFLLMWVAEPRRALAEMARVTRPGGAVMVLAEPDYGGRVDYPEELGRLGELQAEALRAQGADTEMGRKLAGLLRGAGLEDVRAGVLGAEWGEAASKAEIDMEQRVLREDVKALIGKKELKALLEADRAAWARGERLLYVPTFYAWGRAR
jgi:SAM-dependent methyltransferase